MNEEIDRILDAAFSPERIIEAFFDYKLAKWDHFSGFDEPIISAPVGTDGVTYQAFENQLERHARNISHRIHSDTYIFAPFREVEKKKDPDLPLEEGNIRTLGIASIRDALVQNILYKDVLYKRVEELFCELDEYGPVSFSYRKKKSAPLAAQYVHSYIKEGYLDVYDADLSKYFDTIPHEKLLNKLAQVIGGDGSKTFSLVRRFVRTDRTPHKTYRDVTRKDKKVGYKIFHWQKPKRLRPKSNEGVPQGGVLSGMLANLYLHEFDFWVVNELGKNIDLKYVRYADDFIIMVKSSSVLEKIKQNVNQRLSSSDFSLKLNTNKTKLINVPKNDGLNFVGFHFDSEFMRVREKTVERFKKRIREEVFNSVPESIAEQKFSKKPLKWLIRRINSKIQGLRGKEKCPKCGYDRIGAPRSWMAFFSVVTDTNQLRGLDKWIRDELYSYMYDKFGLRIKRSTLKQNGLKSLVNEKYHVSRTKFRPCLCGIHEQNQDIWVYAPNFFQGKSFETLVQKRLFTVPFVDKNGLQISVKNRQYNIEKDVFQGIWDRLIGGEKILRSDLEKSGIRNTSHIVALIAELPGIHLAHVPIGLIYKENPPADFLMLSKRES